MRAIRWIPAVLALGLLVVAATTPGLAAPAAIGFGAPVTLPGSSGGNEPSLAISTDGIRYASWQVPGEFASSPDGVNFTNLGEPDPNASGDVSNAVDAAGALYNGQICGDPQNILHNCIYRSLDGGHTWRKTQLADNHPGAGDRPWIDVYPKYSATAWDPDQTTVYLEYHTFSPEDLVYVTVSHDGGATFSLPHLVSSDTNAISGSGCNTVPGGVAVDQATGAVYALWISGNDVASNVITGCNYSQVGPFNKAWVSVSTDDGATWRSHRAWRGEFNAALKTGDNADKIFAAEAVDGSGQVHVLMAVRNADDPLKFTATGMEDPRETDLLLVTSPDGGQHWTSPFKVHPRFHGSEFFPWIAAGSSGRIDAIYYASSTRKPNATSSTWYATFAQITGAVATVTGGSASYSSTPQVRTVRLDPNAVHVGGICTFGLFCAAVMGNRDLADSIAIAIDPAGGANAVWSNDVADPEGQISFACQTSGPSAYAGFPDLSGCDAAGP